jgi:hypothetical protein
LDRCDIKKAYSIEEIVSIRLKLLNIRDHHNRERIKNMVKSEDKLREISDELNEHIIAVRGTLELVESSVSEGELNDLLVKAIERIDSIQKLSNEMLLTLKQIFANIDKIKSTKTDKE